MQCCPEKDCFKLTRIIMCSCVPGSFMVCLSSQKKRKSLSKSKATTLVSELQTVVINRDQNTIQADLATSRTGDTPCPTSEVGATSRVGVPGDSSTWWQQCLCAMRLGDVTPMLDFTFVVHIYVRYPVSRTHFVHGITVPWYFDVK